MLAQIFLAHMVGDYLLQSHWMAVYKTSRWLPAIAHGVMYTIPFIFITQSVLALLVVGGTHIVIDRYRLAKYVVFVKNKLAPREYRKPFFSECSETGFTAQVPVWLAVWLLIIVDNIIHILINLGAVLYL